MTFTHDAQHAPFRARDTHGVALSVIAPCFNEARNVAELAARTLATFDRAGIDGELVLIDDGSADETWVEIERAALVDPRVRGFRHAVNRGIEAGWRTGMSNASGRLLCLIDSDLQNRPEDMASLYARHRAGDCDLVQGVRQSVNPPWGRLLMTRGLNTLLNTLFGMNARDNKSGFLLGPRHAFEVMLRHRFAYQYFQAFIGVAARARGLVVAEIDTEFAPRARGRSFLSAMPLRAITRLLWESIKFRVELWLPSERITGASANVCADHDGSGARPPYGSQVSGFTSNSSRGAVASTPHSPGATPVVAAGGSTC